ncbi:hypothetical protein V493_05207 [Pseudogymnoascus sp. VKM F-4281 (FW-2241)]|nr:hypothetical protein V493_05207 [Pseudogymnoascus sp. VKM F-4281 (FW-2241)]
MMNCSTTLSRFCAKLAILVFAVLHGSNAAAVRAAAPKCAPAVSGGAYQVTADCIDTTYSLAFIHTETDEATPYPHRRILGQWNGTDVYFNIYLPTKETFTRRFFQVQYPLQTEHATEEDLGFALDNGAYFVQARGSHGYRGDAATAKFSKEVAKRYYGDATSPIYGYVFGGSGGSLLVAGAMENTFGVWEGAVPVVQAIPVSNPSLMAIRGLASLVLEPRFTELADAVSPGGSDPFAVLNSVQKDIFLEATKMGLPPRAWEDYEDVADNALLLQMMGAVQGKDPSYVDDWWSKVGYAGTEESALGDILRAATFDLRTSVGEIRRDAKETPVQIFLHGPMTDLPTDGAEITMYSSNGTAVGSLLGTVDGTGNILELKAEENTAEMLGALAEGMELRIDNRFYISMLTIHRHHIPDREGFYGLDQFRDKGGNPIYPQRAVNIPASIAKSVSGGSLHTGNITMKVIVVDNLLDAHAFPWHADWYRSEVEKLLGDRAKDNYRLWYNDHADHFMGLLEPHKANRLVEFVGIYHQALLDLSDWVEKGIPAPGTSGYTVKTSQIYLADGAAERQGVQPLVNLTANGAVRIEVTTGKPVHLSATIELPPGAGKLVRVEWDPEGTGNFVSEPFKARGPTISAKILTKYSRPGTYLPNVRVTSHRNGDTKTRHVQLMNLGRARVIVSEKSNKAHCNSA